MTDNASSYSDCSQSEPFALQVLGDDMAPEFADGCIIIAEPNAVVVDGCYVIAELDGEFLLRKLSLRGEPQQWLLSALNNDLPTVSISGPADIRARVVQSTYGRRNTRKFYI